MVILIFSSDAILVLEVQSDLNRIHARQFYLLAFLKNLQWFTIETRVNNSEHISRNYEIDQKKVSSRKLPVKIFTVVHFKLYWTIWHLISCNFFMYLLGVGID